MKVIGFLLCLLALTSLGSGATDLESKQEQMRTAIPWLLLLSYPGGLPQAGAPLPGIPIRRPLDELPPSSATMKLPLLDETTNSQPASDLVREQFLQGILQGLRQPGSGATSPSAAMLADFIAQATTTTRKPAVEKDLNAPGNDEDYDYIDFKNGSRIKYDLDGAEQPVNKVLQQTTSRPTVARPQSQTQSNVVYYRQPVRYVYYRPVYRPIGFYNRVG
ncbi:uncharacterized protein LOC110182987 [Drosophila serrata]|uniref:uncharacterized protein LOC110182987 n=1 Tax=Drosophila serrata TaxID=7274 RepID=UPI000A1CF640|nr:uncharacterized protein LOC110182987 [Drosophila serrata]